MTTRRCRSVGTRRRTWRGRSTCRAPPVVPDTFKDEAEVVATGHLDGDTLVVDHIMAKCPSKYEAKPELGAAVDGGVAAMDLDADGASN